MKPHRLTLTNSLVVGYGLHKRMDVFSPREATQDELEMFHDSDYVDFLSRCGALWRVVGVPCLHVLTPASALVAIQSHAFGTAIAAGPISAIQFWRRLPCLLGPLRLLSAVCWSVTRSRAQAFAR